MKYYYKLFLWENGGKSIEYTDYLTVPIFYEDRLNEELDTAEVVLDAMTTNTPFPPKTKFRIERYPSNYDIGEPKIWDMVVEHDDVEEYIGAPGYCCHRIHLIEPSVIAQGMHVDNIAMTYELQDVNLNYKTYNDDSRKIQNLIEVSPGGGYSPIKIPQDPTNKFEFNLNIGLGEGLSTRYFFRNAYFYRWEGVEEIRALNLNINALEEREICFNIPRLICQGCPTDSTFEDLFEMNTITRIYRTELNYDVPVNGTKTLILEKECGAEIFQDVNNSACTISNGVAYLKSLYNWDTQTGKDPNDCFANHYRNSSDSLSIAHASEVYSDKKVKFNTSPLSIAEIEDGKGYLYTIECIAKPDSDNAFIDYYEGYADCSVSFSMAGLISSTKYYCSGGRRSSSQLLSNSVKVTASFTATDLSEDAIGGYLIMKGVKYSCYDLLRKALLTVESQIIDNDIKGLNDIEYSIILDPRWENRLKTAKVQETILENKNLWEVFLQIGYYLHSIPYLQFARDGTDRLMLTFRQLGSADKKNDNSTKITLYNSRNLNDYYSQYDSYVTNIFSPQNLVEEWLVVKTNDSSSLIYNNTAVLKTTYGISEIVAFEITYDGSCGGLAATKDALSHIFEKSIYQILTADYNVSPGMGDSLYYELGKNEINGLSYVPPSSRDVMPMALKRIVGKLFGNVQISKLRFSNLIFHIKYRTQDSMRVSQVRPDIQNFIKNSSYEKYPHHEQYYGQQDKIVDSERFSLNLFGKLVRMGNNIYQCQQMIQSDTDERESGDLVEINGEPYYVTEVENEYYPDEIFQKVTYSKNFNQLSYIVTIPSEPRFYEVSERSKIRREKREFDFFKISTKSNQKALSPTFLSKRTWQSFLKKLIFNKDMITLPNYAWTRFVVDKKRTHNGSYGQYIENQNMFPSSQLDRTNPNQIMPKTSSDHSDVIVPLLHLPIKDGIVFEWDMEDNFKAGDCVDVGIFGYVGDDYDNGAYYPKQAVRYVDVLGRADLYTFRLFSKFDWTLQQSQAIPNACIEPTEVESQIYLPNPYLIGLDKDCREEMSFNYQISLLYSNEDDAGDFITFSNLFGSKSSELYCCLLDNEVSMFNENASVIPAVVLADNVVYNFIENYSNEQLEIHFTTPSNLDLSKVKSIVFYEIDGDGNKVTYIAKNFKEGISGDSLPNFYIYPVYND